MAALYEPAFTYAQNALRGLQAIPPGRAENHKEEGSARSVGTAVDSAKACEDDVLDAHLFMAQLRDAFNGLKVGCSDSDSKEGALAHGVALGKVLQLLFDDPTIKVQVTFFKTSSGRLPGIKIETECPTPCGIPALYVVANDRLTSLRDPKGEAQRVPVREGMIAYRDAILKTEVSKPEHNW